MYILKNALVSINRNKGRNILIGIIIIVIAIAITVTLAIRNSANSLVDSYKEANPLVASLSMNREKVMELFEEGEDSQEDNIENFNKVPSLTLEEVKKYGESSYLSSYYYTYTTSLDSDKLVKTTDSVSKEVTTKETNTTTKGSNNHFPGNRGGMMERNTTTIITKSMEIFQSSKNQTGDFSLVGYSSYEGMNDFVTGTYKISDGSLFTDFTSYNCVVNKELATLNKLEVGSKIVLKNSNNKKTYTFVVSGIYEEDSSNSSNTNMYSNSSNTIIVSSNIVEEIIKDDEDLVGSVEPSFVLKDEDVIAKFSSEVTKEGLSEYYQVSTNLETIASETKSITNVKTFAETFLIITLIIGSVVLLVINMINVRERKYEIGVLRTIGMKKSFVILQFVFELLLVAIIALFIGAGVGTLSSVKVANHLLASEIESANESTRNISKNFGGLDLENPPDSNNLEDGDDTKEKESTNKSNAFNFRGVTKVEAITSIDAVVDYKVVMQLLGIGILLTLISSASAMISISRFSPLTILKERS